MFKKKVFVFLFLSSFIGTIGCDKIFPQKSAAKNNPPPAPAAVSAAKPVENPNAALADNVLAKVGDWTLTKSDFRERLRNLKEVVPDFDAKDVKSKKLVLDELINQELLVKEAEQSGIAEKKEITDAVSEFKRTVLVRESVNKLVGDIKISEQEAQDYYNQNKDIFIEPAEWHLREIMVPTEQEAKDILIELLKGADFAETAKAKSKGKTAASGGDLGSQKKLDPALERAVASLEAGGTSGVFKAADGAYYIVKLEEKKGGKPLNFADIKKDITDGLADLKRRQVLVSHIDELKQKTNIKINEAALSE